MRKRFGLSLSRIPVGVGAGGKGLLKNKNHRTESMENFIIDTHNISPCARPMLIVVNLVLDGDRTKHDFVFVATKKKHTHSHRNEHTFAM